jgi:putative transcriptional regulator
MFKDHLLKEVLEILDLNEFRSLAFRGCFDVLTKKDDTLMIKVLTNIDSFSREHANNLKAMSDFLLSKSLTISVRSNRGTLSDNVIYSRFGIPTMTVDSFRNIITNDWLPSVFAIKGKHVVDIDVNLLRNSREKVGLSLEELGKKVNISKKSLYEIENKRVNPTEETVNRLEDFFGIDLSKNYEIEFSRDYKEINPKTDFQKKIYSKFSRLKINSSCLSCSPFEIVGKKKEIFLTGLSENEGNLEQRSRILSDISSLTDTISVFISKNSKSENVDGVPVILDSEIDELDSYRDFSGLIKERKAR